MSKIDAYVSLPPNAVPPDQWRKDYRNTLPLNHVISRGSDGNALSTISDFAWDWTPYDNRGRRAVIYFYYWTSTRMKLSAPQVSSFREARIREIQYLMVRLLYREEGRTIGPATMRILLKGLKHLARFAELNSCSIPFVLGNKNLLDAFIANVPDRITTTIVVWLRLIFEFDACDQLGYSVAKPRYWKELQLRAKRHWANLKQNAPIPSRIYGSIINRLSSELDDVEEHQERLVALIRAAVAEYDNIREDGSALGPHLIARYSLEEYFERRGFSNTLLGIGKVVGEIFRICKLQIHVFSGMRDAEVQYLPFHCMEFEGGDHGRRHCLISGVTTKLEGGGWRRAKWVTTENEGFRAIRLAQQFSSIIYGSIGLTPNQSEKTKDIHPLFLSTQYLRFVGTKVSQASETLIVADSSLSSSSSTTMLRKRLRPIIEESDLVELENIDPFRAWREEPEYAIGRPWPLKPHQLRRSLAMYANASGLVRLSSLRRQLQHITREMSLYYARGSAFAINFVAEDSKGYKQHIAKEWQDGEQEGQYLAFVRDVLHSEERMYGSAGVYYEMQKERDEILPLEEFKKQIRMGRLAYRPTPLGGCTNPGVCESAKGLRLFDITCATEGCKYLIGKHSKIIQTIRLQRAILSGLDPESITYQIEKELLDELIGTESQWRNRDNMVEAEQGR